MKKAQTISVIIGFLFIAFLGWALYRLATSTGDLGKTLLAVIVAVIPLSLAKVWEQRAKAQQEIRDNKIKVYEHILSFVFRTLMGKKAGLQEFSGEEMAKESMVFTQGMIVWGSSNVLKAYLAFREHSFSADAPFATMSKLEELLRAIRIDIGNDVTGLPNHGLIRLFLNDYSDFAKTPDNPNEPTPKTI